MTGELGVEGQRLNVAAVTEGLMRDVPSLAALIMTAMDAPPPPQEGTARTCAASTTKHAQRARLPELLPRLFASSRCSVGSGTSL